MLFLTYFQFLKIKMTSSTMKCPTRVILACDFHWNMNISFIFTSKLLIFEIINVTRHVKFKLKILKKSIESDFYFVEYFSKNSLLYSMEFANFHCLKQWKTSLKLTFTYNPVSILAKTHFRILKQWKFIVFHCWSLSKLRS